MTSTPADLSHDTEEPLRWNRRAASPEVAKLVADAEARGMERAAKRLDTRIESLVANHGSHEWDTNVTNLPEWVETATEELEEQATSIRAEAAAIRSTTEETGA